MLQMGNFQIKVTISKFAHINKMFLEPKKGQIGRDCSVYWGKQLKYLQFFSTVAGKALK